MIVKKLLFKKGFTIIELVIASSVLAMMLTITSTSLLQFTEDRRLMLLQNEIISETNFLFENIIRYIRNGNIDYQSYWRENIRNHVVDNWGREGPNIRGVNSNYQANGSSYNFNSIKNCSGAQAENDLLESEGDIKGKEILENYIYQFIFPGNEQVQEEGSSYFNYNAMTSLTFGEKVVHLNCPNDAIPDDMLTTSVNEKNVYDDDRSYGKGPRAFSGANAKDWEWSWNPDSSSRRANNNPPLMLLSSDGKSRIAVRYGSGSILCRDSNKIGCILIFESKVPDNNGYNKEGLANKWECPSDYCQIGNLSGILSTEIKWKDITPSNIVVTKFEFNIGPEKDSELAFNELNYVVPSYVTLKMGIEATDAVMVGVGKKKKVKIDLQTTIIPRSLYSVKTLN